MAAYTPMPLVDSPGNRSATFLLTPRATSTESVMIATISTRKPRTPSDLKNSDGTFIKIRIGNARIMNQAPMLRRLST